MGPPEGNGHVTYGYDTSHRMTSITSSSMPGTPVLRIDYETGTNRVKRQTLIGGGTYEFAYVAATGTTPAQTTVKDNRGTITRASFNSQLLASALVEADNIPALRRSTSWGRDDNNPRVKVLTNPAGHRSEFTYDNSGFLAAETDMADTPAAVSTVYERETQIPYRIKSTRAQFGTTETPRTTFAYGTDKKRTLTVINPLGDRTRYEHESDGQVSRVISREAKDNSDADDTVSTSYAYKTGDLTKITDGEGNQLKMSPDGAGRPQKIDGPGPADGEWRYHADDRAHQRSERGTTTYGYRPDERRSAMSFEGVNRSVTVEDLVARTITRTDALNKASTLAYGPYGEVLSSTDRDGNRATHTYDELWRPRTTTYSPVSGVVEAIVTYSYDVLDRPLSVADTASDSVTFTYDDVARTTTETTTPGATLRRSYDPLGRLVQLQVNGEAATNYSYDDAHRLKLVTKHAATGVGQQAIIGYYPGTDMVKDLNLPNGHVRYDYDKAGRITEVEVSGSDDPARLTYDYHDTDQAITVAGDLAKATLEPEANYAYDLDGRVAGRGYDHEGRMTTAGGRTYHWNARGRLVEITQGTATVASFGYDALGRRTSRSVEGDTTSWVYDGANPVGEHYNSIPAELMTTPGGAVLSRRDLTGTDSLVHDAWGSVIAMVDDDEHISTTYGYGPYGTERAVGSSNRNDIGFEGAVDDSGTGLAYMDGRYYEAAMGRYLSQDLGAETAGDTNLYGHVGNWTTSFHGKPGKPWWQNRLVIEGAITVASVIPVAGQALRGSTLAARAGALTGRITGRVAAGRGAAGVAGKAPNTVRGLRRPVGERRF